ncbi:hypothetical protein [Bounagaea algeriensis]
MGNGNGFNAPTEAIDKTGQEVKGLADTAGGIEQNSSRAEVSDSAWGMIGMFVKSDYDDLLQQFSEHLGEVKEGIEKAGDTFQEIAQDYDETDRSHQQSIQTIMDKINTGGAA